MRTLLLWIGRLGLALTLLPAVLFLFDAVTLPTTKGMMVVGMLLWFVSAPITQHIKHEAS